MAGVFFIVCVPTATYERKMLFGSAASPRDTDENLLKLDVELRNKNSVRHMVSKMEKHFGNYDAIAKGMNNSQKTNQDNHVPMEKILEELLTKLKIEPVVWCEDKTGNYLEVLFPVPTGDSCENCLHCLTELGIGVKLNSIVSVLPCSVVYSSVNNKNNIEESSLNDDKSTWVEFINSVKSKLTVKQVVEGVKAGGNLSFDYIMLILTADCLAALGLVENNAPNIVAAMLVSPLMGPVMSLTFGTTISDSNLQKTGCQSLVLGMIVSIIFGFIFGLLLGTTEMPWGFNDWPTEEMKARGNARCLWIGILWALPSGTGVALALLQGSAGPLIGVAISASLLPPVVNCGLFWALSCIWLLKKDVQIPYIQGEPYGGGNSSYVTLYSDYMPLEFFINGLVSSTLTIVNVVFIFVSAIIMLRIKEVGAPYTSTPDVRRFWEKDIKLVREDNKSIRRSSRGTRRSQKNENHEMSSSADNASVRNVLDVLLEETSNDKTFQAVKRVSYGGSITAELGEISEKFIKSKSASTPTTANDLESEITTLLSSHSTGYLRKLSKRSHSGRNSVCVGLPTIPEYQFQKNNVVKTFSLDESRKKTNLKSNLKTCLPFSGDNDFIPMSDDDD